MPEPIPSNTIYTELGNQWNSGNVTTPVIVEHTGDNQPNRIDLNRGDYLIVRPGSPSYREEPIGNWQYVNRTYIVTVDIQTKQSRQRLYDLVAETRRIAYARRHSLSDYQRIQFVSFTEAIDEEVKVWKGTVDIELVNNAVLAQT